MSFDLVADAVEAMAKFCKAFPLEARQDVKVVHRLVELATKGSLRQAKNAAIILSKGGFEDECSKIAEVGVGMM